MNRYWHVSKQPSIIMHCEIEKLHCSWDHLTSLKVHTAQYSTPANRTRSAFSLVVYIFLVLLDDFCVLINIVWRSQEDRYPLMNWIRHYIKNALISGSGLSSGFFQNIRHRRSFIQKTKLQSTEYVNHLINRKPLTFIVTFPFGLLLWAGYANTPP